jgi:hypothetical protein
VPGVILVRVRGTLRRQEMERRELEVCQLLDGPDVTAVGGDERFSRLQAFAVWSSIGVHATSQRRTLAPVRRPRRRAKPSQRRRRPRIDREATPAPWPTRGELGVETDPVGGQLVPEIRGVHSGE